MLCGQGLARSCGLAQGPRLMPITGGPRMAPAGVQSDVPRCEAPVMGWQLRSGGVRSGRGGARHLAPLKAGQPAGGRHWAMRLLTLPVGFA